jgi:hypothetical protein
MAKHWASPLLFALTLAITQALVGCASTKEPAINLPPPTFSGPTIAQKPVAKPAPAPVAQAPAAAKEFIPREWMPTSSPRPWRWIVIHHSASPAGSAGVFDKEHKAKGWDGVGYHFVIGNGTNSADGQVEVTARWPIQKWGAHAKTADNRFNDYGIGICLVGNFDVERPTAAQMRSLQRLVAFLSKTYHVPPVSVVGHRETKATDCPGRYVNIAAVRQMAEGDAPPEPIKTASVELLHSTQ